MLLLLVLGAIATWRVTHMLLLENGPWGLFREARVRLGVVYQDDQVLRYRHELTVCVWCLSVWVGAAFAMLVWGLPDVAMWVMLPYVFSAAAIMLERLLKGVV